MRVVLDFFENLIKIFSTMKFPEDVIDIILVAIIVYYCIKFARDTRMGHLIRGVLLILVLYQAAILMKLSALTYILKNTIQLSFIAIIIVFQPELRSGLERIGRVRFSNIRNIQSMSRGDYNAMTQGMIDSICESCRIMSECRIGALMVFELSVKLGDVRDTGISMDCSITPQTVITVFFPNTPLHDGAMIIRDNKIVSAGCLLPLSKNLEISKELGTRHRAAVGVTETSDALAVIVSEETGRISYALDGKIHIGITERQLNALLGEKLLIPEKKRRFFKRSKNEVTNDEK